MQKLPFFVLLLAGLFVTSCSNPAAPVVHAGPAIDSLLTRYYEQRLPLNPIEATTAGDPRYNDLLPNSISQAHINTLKAFYARYKSLLQQFDRKTLSEKDQASYDILQWECDINLEDLQFHTELMPINQFSCLPLQIGQFAGGSSAQPFKTVADYDHWLKRLDGYVVWCDTAIQNMKRGMTSGYVLPKILAERMVPQMAEFDHGPVEKHLFYAPILQMPADFSEADRQRLKQAYAQMVTDKIIPIYKKLHDFVQNEYVPKCSASSGISSVPNGAAYYAHQVKLNTTTSMSADEVFNLGQQEVARIFKEMEAVKDATGYKGDLKSFFAYVREKKELMPYTSAEQVIQHFHDIHDSMKPQLEKLFDLVPKTKFEIRRTEAFREASASAEYNQGSLDGTRPGIFYVPVPDATKYNIFGDEDLFLHEAIPGHHFQISIQQENTNLPQFRRTLFYNAFGEGWALYSESLGKELGLYKDPYQYFGMLSEEMHRAIRLVVDPGMHTKGWTREQAIQFSLDHEAESEAAITTEIERYMSWPGQATSYKVGQLKIRSLRAKAEKALGPKFDIRMFHNKVLEDGCLPLTLLEAKIDRWIASGK
jgi:uncharacterized protein (DUF885 family)